MKRYLGLLLIVVSAMALCCQAETIKKRYTFDYKGGASRKASEARAQAGAQKRFLADFVAEKLSQGIVDSLGAQVDIALDPPDEFLRKFDVTNTRINPEETQITLTVEGDVDVPAMVAALVDNHVLSFGKRPPKILFLPSPGFQDPQAAKMLRALVYNKVKQAGLQPVGSEEITQVTSVQGKVSEEGTRILAKSALEYNADYLVYIDTEREIKPASVGGYICDVNFTYTVMRPNNNVILGEGVVSERSSGSSAQIAFGKSLDAAAPTLISQAVGQLYESIFSDSDVLTDEKQLSNSYMLTVFFKDAPAQSQALVDALRSNGAAVNLATGGAADRFNVETSMSAVDLYTLLNSLTLDAGGRFKTPVVDFSENTLGVEVVRTGSIARKPAVSCPPTVSRSKSKQTPVQLRLRNRSNAS